MQKVSDILSDYFNSGRSFQHRSKGADLLSEAHSLPVSPSECSWDVHESPERFSRKFRFETKARVSDFVSEVLSYEETLGHDGMLKIDGLEVTVEVYTHDINRITDLDQEYTRHIDAIYKDILHFGY